MNDYGCDWPLWGAAGMMRRGEVGLSGRLEADLASWAREFNLHFDPFDGWDDHFVGESHAKTGLELLERLRSEIGHEYVITPDFWESTGQGNR